MKSTFPAESTESRRFEVGADAGRAPVRTAVPGGSGPGQGIGGGARGFALHGRDAGDAEQLYSVLGLLIIEGRAPDPSEKGRVMGPHVKAGPLIPGGSQQSHLCDQSFNKQCLSAAFYEEELRKYGRHLVPVSVEVLLLPDCALHTSDEPTQRTPTKDQYCLLEQWIIRVLSKHGRARLESLSAVLQAVTSYLHFSQLSAWYIQSRGTRPRHIHYRLSVPGESSLTVSATAAEMYEENHFPRMPIGSAHLLELSVLALRRQMTIPTLPCRQCSGPHVSGVKKRAADSPGPSAGPDEPPSGSTGGGASPMVGDGWKERRSRLTLPLSESSYLKSVDSPKVICSELHVPQDARESGGAVRRTAGPPGPAPAAHKAPQGGGRRVQTPALTEEEEEDRRSGDSGSGGGGRTPVPAKRLKFLYRQTSSEKDLTPFPKPGQSNLEAVVNEFARLNVSAMAASSHSSPPATTTAAAAPPPALPPPQPRPTSHSSDAHQEGPSRKKKREWTILFSDSSSTESLERAAALPPALPPAQRSAGQSGAALTPSLASSRDSLESLLSEHRTAPTSDPSNSTGLAEETAPHSAPSSAPPGPPSGGGGLSGSGAAEGIRFTLFDDSGTEDTEEQPQRRQAAARRSPSASPPPSGKGRRRNSNSCGTTSNDGPGAGDGPAGVCPARNRFLRRRSDSSTILGPGGMLFHRRTGLPTNSSPAPLKRRSGGSSGRFDFDPDIAKLKTVKSATCVAVDARAVAAVAASLRSPDSALPMSASAPATAVSSSRLVVNFEESFLNGRLDPVGVVEGYQLQLAAAGSFQPKHVVLPVTSYFYKLSEDNAPSPYLGYVDLVRSLGKRGYRVPKKGTVQLTLFNPQDSVVKMFVVLYDFTEMPAQSQTFLRQRTLYMPVVAQDASPEVIQRQQALPSYLRYIVHLRFHTTRSGKLFLHTDIRLVFPRDKFEFDPRVATYELKSFTECPQNPRYSPKK